MELDDAIAQITTIRTQLAATEHLRSLRALPVAASGLLAVAGAVAQPWLAADPQRDPATYLWLWCGLAVLSGLLATMVVVRRALRCPGALSIANARLAALQFVPSLAVGAIVTWFVAAEEPQLLWLLPGLWQLLFGHPPRSSACCSSRPAPAACGSANWRCIRGRWACRSPPAS